MASGGTLTTTLCIRASSIPNDDPHTRMTPQPIGEELGQSLIDQVDRAMCFQVDQQRAVPSLASAQGNVIKAQHAWGGHCLVLHGAQQSQQRSETNRYARLTCQPRSPFATSLQSKYVATHDRATEPGERKTILAHLPPYKLAGLITGRETCRTQAASIGPATAEVVQQLLDHRPEDRLHVAQRVLRLAERASAERLERACVRALHYGTPEYPTLKRILAAGLEVVPVHLAESPQPPPPRNLTFLGHASEFAAGLLAAAGGRR
jgi:hypothetical protein